MTKKLVWRLGKLPSVEELLELVKDKIITQEEAKEVLFSQENKIERDTKSLEEEVKFLRALVSQLSQNDRTTIIETIRAVEPPWVRRPWYSFYNNWCTGIATSARYDTQATTTEVIDFIDLKTF